MNVPRRAEPAGANSLPLLDGTFPEVSNAVVVAVALDMVDAGWEVDVVATGGPEVPCRPVQLVRGDGSFDLGAWQTPEGVAPAAGDIAVLENLLLLVDHGQAAPELGADILGRWGLTFRPAVPVSVWCSGLGIDTRGRLPYAAGPNLVPAQLAQLLLSGAAVRAMQLDINHLWVFAATFVHPDPADPASLQGQALLAGMGPNPTHVLAAGARDFLAIYQRKAGL